jgi:hypothetical protein
MSNMPLRNTHDASKQLTREIDDLLRRVDALPNLDSRAEAEILGYGEDGLPRQP